MATGDRTSNIGVRGIASIRIGDMMIQDLPLVASAHAKLQLPLAIDNDRKQRVKDVLKMYPTQPTPALEARIKEANQNILDQTDFKGKLAQQIAQYEGQKNAVEYGRTQLELLDPDGKIAQRMGRIGASRILAEQKGEVFEEPDVEPEVRAKYEQIKSIRVKYPPYNREAMDAQIEQFREGIQKSDDVIKEEYHSIAEFTGVLSLCRQRDKELRNLGVKVGL